MEKFSRKFLFHQGGGGYRRNNHTSTDHEGTSIFFLSRELCVFYKKRCFSSFRGRGDFSSQSLIRLTSHGTYLVSNVTFTGSCTNKATALPRTGVQHRLFYSPSFVQDKKPSSFRKKFHAICSNYTMVGILVSLHFSSRFLHKGREKGAKSSLLTCVLIF